MENFAGFIGQDLILLAKPELDKFLGRFYAGLRKEDVSVYSKKSMYAGDPVRSSTSFPEVLYKTNNECFPFVQ